MINKNLLAFLAIVLTGVSFALSGDDLPRLPDNYDEIRNKEATFEKVLVKCLGGPSPKMLKSIVRVHSLDNSSSGVVLSDEVVASTLHTIKDSDNIFIEDATGNIHKATILSMYTKNDFVLLYVPTLNPEIVVNRAKKLAFSENNYILWTAGYTSTELILDSGHSLAVLSNPEKITVSSNIFKGMSGGPVFICQDNQFKLAGILTGYAISYQTSEKIPNRAYAVNTQLIERLIQNLKKEDFYEAKQRLSSR